jgi:hypothetical protein
MGLYHTLIETNDWKTGQGMQSVLNDGRGINQRRADGARGSSASLYVWLSEGDKRPKYMKPIVIYCYLSCHSPKFLSAVQYFLPDESRLTRETPQRMYVVS